MIELLISAMILNIIDILITRRALSGGAKEVNVLPSKLIKFKGIKIFTVIKIILPTILLIFLYFVLLPYEWLLNVTLLVVNLVLLIICVWNIFMLIRMKRDGVI